jgi:hypothetical protein
VALGCTLGLLAFLRSAVLNQLSGKLFFDSPDDPLLLRSQVPKYEALESLRNQDEPEPEPWLDRELRSASVLRSLLRDQVPVGYGGRPSLEDADDDTESPRGEDDPDELVDAKGGVGGEAGRSFCRGRGWGRGRGRGPACSPPSSLSEDVLRQS